MCKQYDFFLIYFKCYSDFSFTLTVLCGKWESFPREFAKCRRCRKAKYCGKECQSRAWSEGHRFWCSAREGGDEIDSQSTVPGNQILSGEDGEHLIPGNGSRRQGRDRERERHRSANNSTASSGTTVAVPGPSNTSRGNLSPVSPMSYNPIVHAVNSEKPRFLLIPSLCANSVCMFPVPA